MKKLVIAFGNFADASINFISLNKMKKNQILLTTESAVRQILARAINPQIMEKTIKISQFIGFSKCNVTEFLLIYLDSYSRNFGTFSFISQPLFRYLFSLVLVVISSSAVCLK